MTIYKCRIRCGPRSHPVKFRAEFKQFVLVLFYDGAGRLEFLLSNYKIVNQAMTQIGYRNTVLDASERAVFFSEQRLNFNPGVTLDRELCARAYFISGRRRAAAHKFAGRRVFYCNSLISKKADQQCAWLP
jgi:hypothetical protein